MAGGVRVWWPVVKRPHWPVVAVGRLVRSVDFGTIWPIIQHAGSGWFAPLEGRKQDHVRLPAAVAAAADNAPDHTATFHVGQHSAHRPLAQRGLISEGFCDGQLTPNSLA